MGQTITDTLERRAMDAADDIAGPGAVSAVEVTPGLDFWDRLIYRFTFRLDMALARQRVGLIHIELADRLADELEALGDENYPMIRLLDHTDWPKRGA